MNPKTKFYLVYTLIGLAQPFAILFPLAWLFRSLGKWNLLWFVLDDSRWTKKYGGVHADDYAIHLAYYTRLRVFYILNRAAFKITFRLPQWLGVLNWHMFRNRVWNFTELFKVPNGVTPPQAGNQRIKIDEYVSNQLFAKTIEGMRHLEMDSYWATGAGLKYVGEPGENPYQVNKGNIISGPHSIFNTGEIYFTTHFPDGREFKGWRKTSCEIKKIWWLFGAKRYVTTYRGMNSSRYSFKQKYQKVVLIQLSDWTKN